MEIYDKIRKLEIELHSKVARQSEQILNDLIANDFLEFGTSGNSSSKEDIIKRLPNSDHLEIDSFDFTIRKISIDVIQVIYKTKMVIEDEEVKSQRSSLWKNNNGQWQMIFHQSSKISS